MALRGTYGALARLIIINVAVFLTLNIVINILILRSGGDWQDFHDVISRWTDLPSDIHLFLPRIWTFFTYMFVHYGLMHIISNMIIFYFLGRIFSDLLGGARLTAVYILGGLIGGITFVALYNLFFKGNAGLEGASAGVMAVVVAVGSYSPDYIVFFFRTPVKLKWVALIAFVLTTLLDLADNAGGKFAHLGGALFGFIYGTQMRLGKKFLEGFTSLFRFKGRSNLRVEHSRSARANDELYNTSKASLRKRVDEILDKISRSGYDSLTKEEKEFLSKNHDKF